jgi:hypothetical protein
MIYCIGSRCRPKSYSLYLQVGDLNYIISNPPPFGGFGEILPSVMIFPLVQNPSGNIITSGNICRIPLAQGQ